MDVIDRSFTKLPNLNLSRPKNYLGAAVVGNYVIFPGGTYDQNGARGASNDLDVYDRSFVLDRLSFFCLIFRHMRHDVLAILFLCISYLFLHQV